MILTRYKSTPAHILGKLMGFQTLELPWRDNQENISCIPTGSYKIGLHKSFKFGECLKIYDVPNRSDILIHAGNFPSDTKGCILIGEEISENEQMILQSKQALQRLLGYFYDRRTHSEGRTTLTIWSRY